MPERPVAARRYPRADDLFRIRLLSDAQIAPDGADVAYVETRLDPEDDAYRSQIWTVPFEAGKPEPFTVGGRWSAALPRWSRDGSQLAFLSDRNDAPQIWVMPRGGGEARQLTDFRQRPMAVEWSPDGRKIAFVARVGREGLEPADGGEERDEGFLPFGGTRRRPLDTAVGECPPPRVPRVAPGDPWERFRARYTADVIEIDRLLYRRDGVGFFRDTYLHVFTVPVEGGPHRTARRITDGDFDHFTPVWSPDGRWIAVSANRLEDPDYHPFIRDIWLFAANGGGAQRKLTRSRGPAYAPAWSPDGRRVAYFGHDLEYGTYTQPRLWVVPAGGGEPVAITQAFDRPVGVRAIDDLRESAGSRPAWSGDGRAVYFQVSERGMVHLYRADVESRRATPVVGGQRVVLSHSLSADGSRAAFVVTAALLPNDVYAVSLDRPGLAGERRLTAVNQDYLREVALSEPERFEFHAEGGPPVEGWILRPRAAGQAPGVVEIHGGPQIMYGYAFFLEFQLLAAAGFAVIYANPRGSMGYGQKFVAAIRGDWGNEDFADVMAGTDAAVRLGGIDPRRLGIAGGSYGGFMTNWAIGHTDRFRAAVTMRSISNMYSFFGTSDFGYTEDEEFKGPPWEKAAEYLRRSPISYLAKVSTPLLVIHSELDFRTPIEQGEQFYVALKYLRRPVKMLRFPGETHDLSRAGQPWHRVHRLEAIVDWFRQHLRGAQPEQRRPAQPERSPTLADRPARPLPDRRADPRRR